MLSQFFPLLFSPSFFPQSIILKFKYGFGDNKRRVEAV